MRTQPKRTTKAKKVETIDAILRRVVNAHLNKELPEALRQLNPRPVIKADYCFHPGGGIFATCMICSNKIQYAAGWRLEHSVHFRKWDANDPDREYSHAVGHICWSCLERGPEKAVETFAQEIVVRILPSSHRPWSWSLEDQM